MRSIRDISITQKLRLIIMLTSGAALLLACMGFGTYEWFAFRQDVTKEQSTLAQIIGANSVAAVTFNDAEAAEKILSALKAEPEVVAACIYSQEGKLFAAYVRPDVRGWSAPTPTSNAEYFKKQHVFVDRPILHNGERVGTIHLEADLHEMQDRLHRYALIVLVVLSLSSLAALILSARLQRVVSGPIMHLSQTARAISEKKDYSLRAVRRSGDELGLLIDSFNEMLSHIQDRTAALQESEAALRESEERFRQIAENIREVFWMSSADWSKVLYFSPAYEEVWGRTCASVYAQPQSWMDAIQAEDLPQVHGAAEKSFAGQAFIVEFRIIRPDGSVRWIRDRGFPVHDQSGQLTRVVGIAEDITERKLAELELESLHKQLVDASRQGGMAEVATNVLHNVGNVLNSVNISTSVVADKLRQSKVTSLGRAAALLREHENDLVEFLARDPQGKKLPGYLTRLAEYLEEERAAMLKEISSLTSNVDHIKEIVAMQQGYAQVAGVLELLPVVDLVEDAIRLNEGSLVRHEVALIREFETVPSIQIEKHKVLQILVNLIRNAKHALDDGKRSDKRLTIRVGKNGKDSVKISVIDNGVGIPPENMPRIFEHGFTTRKGGHGFGLHSAALTAKELGGSLIAHSDGHGHGASFTLELPHQNQKANYGHKRF